MIFDLDPEEKLTLAAELKRIIEADHYQLSLQIQTLRRLLEADDLERPARALYGGFGVAASNYAG